MILSSCLKDDHTTASSQNVHGPQLRKQDADIWGLNFTFFYILLYDTVVITICYCYKLKTINSIQAMKLSSSFDIQVRLSLVTVIISLSQYDTINIALRFYKRTRRHSIVHLSMAIFAHMQNDSVLPLDSSI